MSNKRNLMRITSILFVSALFFLSSIPSSFASEKVESKITKEQEKELRNNFKDMGITAKTANKLVEKVSNGELLDSQKQTEITKHKDELFIDPEHNEKYVQFKDGSRIMVSLEKAGPVTTYDYATGSVKYGTCSSGTGYRNCNVTARYNDGIWNISFNAKVSTVQGGYDSITSISRPSVDAVLYSVVQKKFKIMRTKETSSAAALAEYTNQFTHKTGLYTVTRTLSLYAKSDKIYARLNYY